MPRHKTKNSVQFQSNLLQVEVVLEQAAKQHMHEACKHLVSKIKESLTGQGSGRKYKKYRVAKTKTDKSAKKMKPRAYYIASAPGEVPAARTKQLKRSIRYKVKGKGINLNGLVGSQKFYARMLETGTDKMAARPFLRPAYERERETIKSILKKRWL